ncbi:hypothetical protein [Microbacterium yannicii]|nr:hypothetical protein [Microbacterium yannicii]MCO5953634.1 hypothetical protein [Microbacterium yannicii]
MSSLMRSIARPDAHRTYRGRFVAFTDALLLGVLVLLGSLPVVTWFVAVAAGARLARLRETEDATVGWRTYWKAWRDAAASGFVGSFLVPVLVLGVLAADLFAVRAGLDAPATAAAAISAIVLATVALRTAAEWRVGIAWSEAVRAAVSRASTDLSGTALLATAVVGVALIVTWVPPVAIAAGGPLCVAAAAVRARAESRASADIP